VRTVSPWMRGVIDTLVGAELLRGSAIPHRNRLVVILIDSAFETACRAFLQHKEKIKMGDSHRHRDNLISTMRSKPKSGTVSTSTTKKFDVISITSLPVKRSRTRQCLIIETRSNL
jgi:hypothetical protein